MIFQILSYRVNLTWLVLKKKKIKFATAFQWTRSFKVGDICRANYFARRQVRHWLWRRRLARQCGHLLYLLESFQGTLHYCCETKLQSKNSFQCWQLVWIKILDSSVINNTFCIKYLVFPFCMCFFKNNGTSGTLLLKILTNTAESIYMIHF